MPTSSIFTNIIINDQKKAEKFIDALEASSNDPAWEPKADVKPSLKDVKEIRKLMGKKGVYKNTLTKCAELSII